MSGLAMKTVSLTKIFAHRKIAVSDLSLEVPEHSIYGFLGPNGSGKTTTIKLMLGLLHPSAGYVEMLGKRMGIDSSEIRQRIGYLPTNPKFPERMNPIQYLDFVGRLFGLAREERLPRIAKLMRSVELLSMSSSEMRKLSTGESTRVGIAACLMNDPELLIMDEPTTGLDPIGRASTVRLISELGRKGDKTIFVSSHILADIDRICTHVGIVNHGKLIFNGTITEVKKLIHRNTIELHVDGKDEQLQKFVIALRKMQNIINIESVKQIVKVSIDDKSSYSKALLAVFGALVDSGLELVSLKAGSDNLEDAFLNLLEEEKAHGFLRAISSKA